MPGAISTYNHRISCLSSTLRVNGRASAIGLAQEKDNTDKSDKERIRAIRIAAGGALAGGKAKIRVRFGIGTGFRG